MDVESLSMYLAIKSVHFIVSFFYINEYTKYTINRNLISLQGNSEAWKIYCDYRFQYLSGVWNNLVICDRVNKSKRKRYLDKWDVRWCVWPFSSVWYTDLSFSQRVWRWFPRWCRDQIWSPELCVSSSVHEMSSAVSVTRLTLTNSSCWYLYRARRSALITAARVSINIIIQKTDVHISVCVFMS